MKQAHDIDPEVPLERCRIDFAKRPEETGHGIMDQDGDRAEVPPYFGQGRRHRGWVTHVAHEPARGFQLAFERLKPFRRAGQHRHGVAAVRKATGEGCTRAGSDTCNDAEPGA